MVLAYVGIVCLSTYIGFIFSRKYIVRYKIYSQLIEFLNYYKLQICYNQKKILDVVNDFAKSEKDDFIQLNEFSKYLKFDFYNKNSFEFNEKLQYLSELEINQIESIFNNLGKFDLEQEKQNVELILSKLNSQLISATNDKTKYCGFCVKIGAILGCFLVVLLL